MKEQDKFSNDITCQSNINTLSFQNDNNDKQLSTSNIQLNNFNQIPQNINSNLNINNIASLSQLQNLSKVNISLQNEKNMGPNLPNQNKTSEFPLIEDLNQKKDILNNLNNTVYANQNNNTYNFNNYFNNNNNINNHYDVGYNNKSTKPYFTSKHSLLNSNSLAEVNECINKDLFQLEKFLPYYKNYINSNNSESINICLKYIKYTNFFFNKMITNKVNEIFYKIIYSDNYNNYENNQNYEIYNFKKKIKELYKKLIPFDLRMNYLNEFYEKNCENKLYNLFKNDLNKYQRYDDKKYYLFEIFEIVKQKMNNKDKEEINNYFNRLFYNSKNQNSSNYNNSLPSVNNGMNNERNGGNYSSNYNNYHNNSGRQYRKYSYQSPNSEIRTNNSNYNNYDNNSYKNNGNNYHHMNYNNKNNNYNNINIDNDGYKNNHDNSHHHNSSYQRNNNYKGSFSSRHYYINNNNNKNINLRNKGNKKTSSYSGVLVEVDSTPKKSDIENDKNELLNQEEYEQNIINNKEEEKMNDNNQNGENVNQKEEENINLNIMNEEINDVNKEEFHNININNEINHEEIDLENNLNINNENSKKENININEDYQLYKNEDDSDGKNENENIFNDFNSINPFNDNVTSSEENNSKEDSNNNIFLKKSQSENNIFNMKNKLEINSIDNNNNTTNNQEENTNSLIQNIINDTEINSNTNNQGENANYLMQNIINDDAQNNMINATLYKNNMNNIENKPTNDLIKNDINIKEDHKNNEDIKIEKNYNQENNIKNNINKINITENETEKLNENNINNNKNSRSPSPKNISLSDSNIINFNLKINKINSNNQDNSNLRSNNHPINSINNNNNLNSNIINNNLNNEQLQILKLLASQNYNLLMNINSFQNSLPPQLINQHNNFNNSQIKNNINNNHNINNNMNNFNNLNLLNNLNSNINLFNNNFYYPNIYQNYNTIFFNYWNDENNLLSNLRNSSSNIHPSNYNNNINYIKKKNDKLSIEYNIIKKFEKENPEKIQEFKNLFEEKIILPIYIKINEENQIKKEFYTEIYNKYKKIILKILSKHNLEDTQIEPFGSIVNNFMTEWGDIDICIVPKENNLIQNFWEYLEEIKEEVINVQKVAKFTLIERYPRFLLLKLVDKETNIDLDITVQNLLPISNTKLIRQYSLLDQRFHVLGIFLKFWVKKNKIHGALDKFLSSYALLILLIHYLQNNIEPKILPILQQIQNVKNEYIYYYEERELKTNLYFEEDLEKINNYMNIINDQNENNCSVVDLLIGFFDFYAYKYKHYLISISRSDKKPINEEETVAFPLEDPFDVNYNPGKSMQLKTLQYSLFIYCMKKELNNILSGEYFKYSTGE